MTQICILSQRQGEILYTVCSNYCIILHIIALGFSKCSYKVHPSCMWADICIISQSINW